MNLFIKSLLISFLLIGTSADIVMRHDVDDSKYLELAKKYGEAVSKFSAGCGTLIRPNWAITAAHAADASYFQDYMEIGGKRYTIKRKIIHPDFTMSGSILNDIALIELSEPVKGITPAILYQKDDEMGKEIIFAGTGWAGTGDKGMVEGDINKDRKLRAAQNLVDGIKGDYIQFTFDKPGSANALPMEGISGPGDSGGPALLFQNNKTYLLGVSSHQDKNGNSTEGMYGAKEYYTRISHYYDWIIREIGE